MDTRTGIIFTDEQRAELTAMARSYLLEMKDPPTPAQARRDPMRVGRNEPCPCGSGKKFKRCHFRRGGETGGGA